MGKQEETEGDNLNSFPTCQLSCTGFRFLWGNEDWSILPMWRQDSTLKRHGGSCQWTPPAAGWLRTMLPYFALLHSIVGITISHLFMMSHNYLVLFLSKCEFWLSDGHPISVLWYGKCQLEEWWELKSSWGFYLPQTPILLCGDVTIAIEFRINVLVGSSLPEIQYSASWWWHLLCPLSIRSWRW